MNTLKSIGIFLTVLFIFGCTPVSDAPPLELSTEVWRGNFNKGNVLSFVDLELKRDGDKVTGRYYWSEYGRNMSNRGKLSGEIKGNKLHLSLEDPKKGGYSEVTMELSMAECSPEEAKKARQYVKQLKGLPSDFMTKKLMKLYGPMSYKLGETRESVNGYVAESHPKKWKPNDNRDF